MMNLPGMRRHFRKAGNLPLAPGMDEFTPYGYKPLGSSEQWRVTLENMTDLAPITKDEYDQLEEMGAWETEHIYTRMREGQRFEVVVRSL
jgi:hypothetical protein